MPKSKRKSKRCPKKVRARYVEVFVAHHFAGKVTRAELEENEELLISLVEDLSDEHLILALRRLRDYVPTGHDHLSDLQEKVSQGAKELLEDFRKLQAERQSNK